MSQYYLYGASINEIATSLIVTSLSTVLFSIMQHGLLGKIEKVGKNLQQSLECLLVIIMPIMVMCFVAGDLIVRVYMEETALARMQFGKRLNGVVIGYAAGFFFRQRERLSLRFTMLFKIRRLQ